MEFFIYPFLLGERECYVLWFTDDVDGVLINQDGRVATFSSVEAVRIFAQDQGLTVSSEVSPPIDLRWIVEDSLTSDNLDCVKTLNAWNFFADVAASLPSKAGSFIALDKSPSSIYEKVFWGNNLPAVTPHGERFDPIWLETEIAKIKAILESGLELFVANLDFC